MFSSHSQRCVVTLQYPYTNNLLASLQQKALVTVKYQRTRSLRHYSFSCDKIEGSSHKEYCSLKQALGNTQVISKRLAELYIPAAKQEEGRRHFNDCIQLRKFYGLKPGSLSQIIISLVLVNNLKLANSIYPLRREIWKELNVILQLRPSTCFLKV